MALDAILRRVDPAALPALLADEERFTGYMFDKAAQADGDALWLGRDWARLQFVLTGSDGADAGPLSLRPAFEPDASGAAPAYVFPVDRIADFDRALSATPDAVFEARFEPSAMADAGVYKAHADDRWDDLAGPLSALRSAVARYADAKSAAILYVF